MLNSVRQQIKEQTSLMSSPSCVLFQYNCESNTINLLKLSGVRGSCFLVENGSPRRVPRRSSSSRALTLPSMGLVVVIASAN